MTARPTLREVEAAARILSEARLLIAGGVLATDPIGKEEFDAIAEAMLIATSAARS
jgi:hypothetical protein